MKKKKISVSRLCTTMIMALAVFTMMFPLLWMLSTSFKTEGEVFDYPMKWIISSFSFKNYAAVLTGKYNFLLYFYNSVKVTLFVVVLQLTICSMGAYAFAKMKFRFREPLFALFLATMMIPDQVTLVPRFLIINGLKLYDTHMGLILPMAFSVYGVFLLRQNMISIPDSIVEAAYIDGAGHWTWDDYKDYAVAMTSGSGADKVYGSFMHSWSKFKREGLFNTVMDNPYVKEDGTSNLDSPYFGEWLQYMYDLENVYHCQTPYSDVKASGLHYRDIFLNGKAAMIPIGSWMVDTCINTEEYPHDFQTVVAPFPVFSDGKPGVTQGSASYFVIGSNTSPEKAKAAYEFMRWMSNEGSVALNIFPSDK